MNATRWDVVSREAGVVAGADQWATRLHVHLAAIRTELADLIEAEEASEWQLRRLQRERDETAALAAFVAGVAEALVPPDPATWQSLAHWAASCSSATRARRGNGTTGPSGRSREQGRSRRRSTSSARSMRYAAPTARSTSRGSDGPSKPSSTRASSASGGSAAGVLVGQLGQAYTSELDAVYVLGAVEGVLPPRGREDPLLPDRERRDVAGLAQRSTRRLEERRDYLAALAAGEECVLTFPRADPRAQRKRLPARWVLESARHLSGSRPHRRGAA